LSESGFTGFKDVQDKQEYLSQSCSSFNPEHPDMATPRYQTFAQTDNVEN
jgi:hypothetical protein